MLAIIKHSSSVILGVVLAVMTGCQPPPTEVQNGVLVSTRKDELTITGQDGGDIRTFRIAPRTTITFNGRPADLKKLDNGLDQLSRGQSIRVVVQHQGGDPLATNVAATMAAVRHRVNKPIFPIASPPAIPQIDDDQPNAKRAGEESKSSESQSNRLKMFEGVILFIDEDGFMLQVGHERRFVTIPDNANVMVLDDRKKQAGQIASVMADFAGGDYVARGIIVRPKESD